MSYLRLESSLGDITRHWPRLALTAGLDLLIGVAALAWPGVTILALALILGVVLLVSGFSSIAFGARTAGSGLWPTVLGVISVIAGVMCLLRPGTGVIAIALVAALWFLVTGFTDLAIAAATRRHRLWWGFLGALSLVAGIVLLFDLRAAVVTVAIVVGVSFLLRGAAELMLAGQLRQLHQATRG